MTAYAGAMASTLEFLSTFIYAIDLFLKRLMAKIEIWNHILSEMYL